MFRRFWPWRQQPTKPAPPSPGRRPPLEPGDFRWSAEDQRWRAFDGLGDGSWADLTIEVIGDRHAPSAAHLAAVNDFRSGLDARLQAVALVLGGRRVRITNGEPGGVQDHGHGNRFDWSLLQLEALEPAHPQRLCFRLSTGDPDHLVAYAVQFDGAKPTEVSGAYS